MQIRPMMFNAPIFRGAEPKKSVTLTDGVKALAPRQQSDFIVEFASSHNPNEETGLPIPVLKENMQRRVDRLAALLQRHGLAGEIEIGDSAWINETLRIRGTREAIERLVSLPQVQDEIQLIDVPRRLIPD